MAVINRLFGGFLSVSETAKMSMRTIKMLYANMKYLAPVLLFLVCLNVNAQNEPELIGQIDTKTLTEMKLEFDHGVDVILEGYVLRTLPKNLASRIYKIKNTDGYFKIYFTQHDNQYGYDILSAKYVCSSIPCKLMFFKHVKVKS